MPGVAILRRRVFRTLGQFEENWQIASDIVWFAKLRNSAARIDVIDDVLLYKRIHSSNLSNVAASMPVYREELLALANSPSCGSAPRAIRSVNLDDHAARFGLCAFRTAPHSILLPRRDKAVLLAKWTFRNAER